jgi:hypothetical protein
VRGRTTSAYSSLKQQPLVRVQLLVSFSNVFHGMTRASTCLVLDIGLNPGVLKGTFKELAKLSVLSTAMRC